MFQTRVGPLSNMCTSKGRQYKTVSIQGLFVLVHPIETWMFSVSKSAMKVPKCREIWDKCV